MVEAVADHDQEINKFEISLDLNMGQHLKITHFQK